MRVAADFIASSLLVINSLITYACGRGALDTLVTQHGRWVLLGTVSGLVV